MIKIIISKRTNNQAQETPSSPPGGQSGFHVFGVGRTRRRGMSWLATSSRAPNTNHEEKTTTANHGCLPVQCASAVRGGRPRSGYVSRSQVATRAQRRGTRRAHQASGLHPGLGGQRSSTNCPTFSVLVPAAPMPPSALPRGLSSRTLE